MALTIFGASRRLGLARQWPSVRRFKGFAAPRSSVYLAFREISLSGCNGRHQADEHACR